MKLLKAGFTILTGMLSMMAFALPDKACAQNSAQMVRLAKLVIDSAQLELYKAALKEGVEAAMPLVTGSVLISWSSWLTFCSTLNANLSGIWKRK